MREQPSNGQEDQQHSPLTRSELTPQRPGETSKVVRKKWSPKRKTSKSPVGK